MQLAQRTWPTLPRSPVDLRWSDWAPGGFDPNTGAVQWVHHEVPTQLLRWLCMARGVDAGGSNHRLVHTLRSCEGLDDVSDDDVPELEEVAPIEGAHAIDQPPSYEEAVHELRAEEESMRHWCSMHTIEGEGSHWRPVMGIAVFIGLVPAAI